MKEIYTNDKDSFEIVKKIPPRFTVWNIGNHMKRKDLIPLCELKNGGTLLEIEPTTLKAIKLPVYEAELIRKAAQRGIDCLATARKYTKSTKAELKALALSAMPIYERITE